MENSLFRKKSMERISSPEELHDYMRVTSPRLWMLLGAIAVLLVGFIVYASTATMENVVPIRVQVDVFDYSPDPEEGGETRQMAIVSCALPTSWLDTVKTGMTVRIGKEKGTVGWIATVEGEDVISLVIDMENDNVPLQSGTYDADLVLESTTPISFLWN